MAMDTAAIEARLREKFGDAIVSSDLEAIDPFVIVKPEAIAGLASFCKEDEALSLDNLMCLSGVDYPGEDPPRMEVVYHLFSYTHGHRLMLKVQLDREQPKLATVEDTWGVANWHEREAYDLLGIEFEGHSDLRRILLPDDWQGHPLRKDWEDPEFYNGLRVKPTQQMAERAKAGDQIGVGPFQFTPPNRHVE